LDKVRTKKTLLLAGILASAALFIMPNSPTLWFAAGMLWIMDASINVSMEPFRALLEIIFQATYHGVAMQSFFIGWCLLCIKTAFDFTYLGVDNTAPLGIIPDSVKILLLFWWNRIVVPVLWTVITSKEYSPEELAAFEKQRN
jgi:maltose/moltooligosaccharide transporter